MTRLRSPGTGHRLTTIEGAQPCDDDRFGRGEVSIDPGMRDIRTERVNESGPGGSRAQRRHGYPRAAGLRPQGLAERKHERLYGAVGGLIRGGLERDRRRHVQDAARTTGQHSRKHCVAEAHRRIDVHSDQVVLSVGIQLREGAMINAPNVGGGTIRLTPARRTASITPGQPR
jgi:hypothetical protein